MIKVGEFDSERQWEDYRVRKWLNRGWTFATGNGENYKVPALLPLRARPEEIPF